MYGYSFRVQGFGFSTFRGVTTHTRFDDRVLVNSADPIKESKEDVALLLRKAMPGYVVTPIKWPGMPDEWADFVIPLDEIR